MCEDKTASNVLPRMLAATMVPLGSMTKFMGIADTEYNADISPRSSKMCVKV